MVTEAPYNLAVPTTAGVPFDSTKWLTFTFVRIRQSKGCVPKKEPGTVLKDDCLVNIIGDKGIKEERILRKRYLRTGDVLEEGSLLGENEKLN